MRDSNWGKLAAGAGLIFAVTFVAGALTAGANVEGDDPDAKILSWWSDSGHQTQVLIGGFLLAVSALAFLWFISHVRERLVTFEGQSHQLSTVAFAGGVVFAAMVLAGLALFAGPAGAAKFGSTDIPKDADILRQLPQVGFGMLLIGGAWAAALTIAAISWATLRTGVFGRWLAWLGFVAAIALIFGVLFLPMIALPIWVIAASVELWRRPAAATA